MALYRPEVVGLVLLLDTVPEYIRRTFGLTPLEGGTISPAEVVLPNGSNLVIIREGEVIPADISKYLVLHHTSMWHIRQALGVAQSILSVHPEAWLMVIGVVQD